MKFTRRTLAKGLAAAGALAGSSLLLSGESQPILTRSETLDWKEIHPGVWRATLGTPEGFTPVSSRLVPPQTDAFQKLPDLNSRELPAIKGKTTARGCILQLPLHPNEEVYGLGLQLLSFTQRGKKKVTRVNADPKFDTGDSHAPVPFFVTTGG